MSSEGFHERPFDDGTIVKLEIVELYAREWLPVFLSRALPNRSEIHLFDFFAGPGTDSLGVPGSPIRLLRQLKEYRTLDGWGRVNIHVHLFDGSKEKIEKLRDTISSCELWLDGVCFDVRPVKFSTAFHECRTLLSDRRSAKLVFIDQFGVDHVNEPVFRALVDSPTCDFLFFISSSTINRFGVLPAIKQKIQRPEDSFHVHRAVWDYYRGLIESDDYYLAPFSIKKASNIYGLIFGTRHALGIDKFLEVAWQKDKISGEADFDIHRDNLQPGQLSLEFEEMKPTKIKHFENRLEAALCERRVRSEADLIRFCFERGMRRQHAVPVLARLKTSKVIKCEFRVPDIRNLSCPRTISLI